MNPIAAFLHQTLFYKLMINRNRFFILLTVIIFLFAFINHQAADDNLFVTYTVHPKQQNIRFYWKDEKNTHFKTIQNLKTWLEKNKQTLVFAMNGGMYKTDFSPLGLYIENYKTMSPLNKSKGSGNFYMQPNGVFYITENNTAVVCTTEKFVSNGKIKYATQSGPMLVINDSVHPAFKKGSANVNIRNGVGILPGGGVVFAMSKKEISLYEFANYFKQAGCKNALYLDGFVSRTYLPQKNWLQTDGNFGVMIAVSKPQ